MVVGIVVPAGDGGGVVRGGAVTLVGGMVRVDAGGCEPPCPVQPGARERRMRKTARTVVRS